MHRRWKPGEKAGFVHRRRNGSSQTNRPQGPGTLIKPQKVFAGVDRVAMDVYGANLLGLKGEEIRTTRMAHEHGLGEIHLARLQIQEVTL